MSALHELKIVDNEELERRRIAEKLGYLTEDQVASLAKAKPATVEDWRKRGRGPVYTVFGNAFLYELDDVLAFIKSRRKDRFEPSKAAQAGV